MKATEALRLLEQKLIPARTIAGCDAAWEVHRRDELPEFAGEAAPMLPLVQQGFEAGYAAAMSAVRRLLAEVQTTALREVES